MHNAESFDYATAKPGDEVTAEVVLNVMNCMPPAMMRTTCAQMGEPYSHRSDPATGKFRPTFATFRCKRGDFTEGVWEFCGYCFAGETVERGDDPPYVRSADNV